MEWGGGGGGRSAHGFIPMIRIRVSFFFPTLAGEFQAVQGEIICFLFFSSFLKIEPKCLLCHNLKELIPLPTTEYK